MAITYNASDKVNHNSVGAIIYNEKGEILVEDHIEYNFITLPIGKSDLNREQGEELKRAIKEETNIDIKKFHEVCRKPIIDVRDGTVVIMNIILFEVTKWSGEAKNMEPDKHRFVEFMNFDEILKRTDNGKNTSWMTQMFIENEKKS